MEEEEDDEEEEEDEEEAEEEEEEEVRPVSGWPQYHGSRSVVDLAYNRTACIPEIGLHSTVF
jgi:hypothetical protein